MEKEYNWKAILIGSIPVSILMFFVFNSGISSGMKNFYLALGMLVSMGITYSQDKKKRNIFTSPFIVVLISLLVHALNRLGVI